MSNKADEPLWSQINYLTEARFHKGLYIREYDIQKANITVLLSLGLINTKSYDTLYYMDKSHRESTIGRWIRDEKESHINKRSITEEMIKFGISEAKRLLFEANHIKDEEVLRIANDSVLVYRPLPLENTSFILNTDNQVATTFLCKGEFTLFVKLAKTVILFNSQTGNVEAKGINDSKLLLHQDFLSIICQLLYYKELGDSKVALMNYHNFYNQYINRLLPISFYREFNAESGYRLLSSGNKYASKYYGLLMPPDGFDINKLDISYNLYVLRDLYAILISE